MMTEQIDRDIARLNGLMHTAGPQLTENIVSLLALSFIGLFAIFFWAIWLTCVELPKLIRWLQGYR